MHDSQVEPLDLSPFAADVPVGTPPPLWYVAPGQDAAPALRLLPEIGDAEPPWKRWLFALVAVAICGGYFFFLHSFWAPAPGRLGVDENAYLVGGRNLVDHHSTGFKPPDDFGYVGLMWVQSPKNGWYYPKYSIGQSVLNAIALKIGGETHGTDFAFLINPICTSLALLAIFLLVRAISNSFWGLLSMFLLGFCYTTLERANNPDSHVSDLFFITAGMFLFLRWWQTGSTWRGIVAGLLLGIGATIRFSEAQLIFPIFQLDHFLSDTDWWKAAEPRGGHLHWLYIFVKMIRFLPIGPLAIGVLCTIRWKRFESYLRAALPLAAWAIPVGAMIWFNYATIGTLSGYDLTHESEGFKTQYFLEKWPFAVDQVYRYGLFLTLPLGVVGLALLFRRSVRTALFLSLWFVPNALLYVAYYWGDHTPGVAYLRFFLSFYPPMLAAALWLIYSANRAITATPPRRGAIAAPLAGGLITASVAAVAAMICLPDLNIEQRQNIDQAYSADRIVQGITRTNRTHQPPVAFCDEGMLPYLLEFMQFRMKGDWYSTDAFEMRFNGMFGGAGFQMMGKKKEEADKLPVLIQQSRIEAQDRLMQGKTSEKLADMQRDVMKAAIDQHRCVYAVLSDSQINKWKKHFITAPFEARELDHWTEPCAVPSQEDHGALAPPKWPDFLHRGRQELYLIQIIYKQKP